ncbi:MAG: DNA-binding protein [Alphaproteobacteria bacterium]|nr:DNA-binding protein [Alphaproteobacteria bacterium]
MPSQTVVSAMRMEGEKPVLIGGRAKDSGAYAFPMPTGPAAARYEETALASEGTLWSFTVQRFPPKTPFKGELDPKKFKPYAVGYVELPGQIIVETRIKTDNFQALKIGMPMRLTTDVVAPADSADGLLTYAFEPV